MNYEQEQIKPLLEDKSEFGYKIKITSTSPDNKETNWFYISKETLTEFYNSLNIPKSKENEKSFNKIIR